MINKAERDVKNIMKKISLTTLGLLVFTNFHFNGITGANRVICSEAVARILFNASGGVIDLSKEYLKSFDTISPMEVYFSKHIFLSK